MKTITASFDNLDTANTARQALNQAGFDSVSVRSQRADESAGDTIRADEHGNVADAGEVKAMVAAAVSQFGRLDYAFNNAGINNLGQDEYQDEVWARSLAVNLSGVMHCMREESEVMLAQGGGAIVNTASINGIVGNGAQPGYCATKHGVVGLTRHGALRWAKAGIRVNAVCPGVIETPMTAPLTANPEMKQVLDAMTPMGRMGRAEEVASAVVWLCSDAASFVTGHPLVIDGGATAV